MSWRERKELMQGSSYKVKKIFSFSVFMIILLASFTIVFVVMPFNAKADIPTAPTIGEITYGGWDKDGECRDDNCYAQYREYSITVTYTDMNGWDSLQTVSLCLGDYTFMPGTTRVTFTYDVAERTFGVVTAGLEKWDLESDCWTPGDVVLGPHPTDDITITWRFTPQWDADEDIDLDIQAKADDGGFPEAIQPEMNIFDVVTTLLTNKLESTFDEVPDDHVDVGSAIQMDFEIRYADEPESSTPQSEIYPPSGPEGEFGEVTLFKVAENEEPCEDPIGDPFLGESITEGGGTFELFVPPGGQVAEHTFRLQVTMTDNDYGDAGVGWLINLDETVITDRIKITALSPSDSRISVGGTTTLDLSAEYEYGGLVQADSITISGDVLDKVEDGLFQGTTSSQSSTTTVGYNTFDSILNDFYGLTVGNINGQSAPIIWDQIIIDAIQNDSGDGRVNLSDSVIFSIKGARLEHDDTLLNDVDNDNLQLNVGSGGTFDGDNWLIPYSSPTVGKKTISLASGTEDTYGITAVTSSGYTQPEVIWDKIWVNWSATNYVFDAASDAEVTINFADIVKYHYDEEKVSKYSLDIKQTYCDVEEFITVDVDETDTTVSLPVTRPGVYNYTITSCQDVDGYDIGDFEINETISINVMQNFDLDTTINGGLNYITWCRPNTTAGDLNASLGLNPQDKIMKYNTTNGNFDTDVFVSHTEMINFTINTWDIIRIDLLDGATSNIDMSLLGGTIYPYQTKTFDYNSNNGGFNYFSWSDGAATAVSDLASTLTLPTGYCVYKFDPSTGNWDTYITNITPSFDVNPNDVLCCWVNAEKQNINLYST